MNSRVDLPTSKPLSPGFQLGALSIDPRAGEAIGPGGCEKLDPKVMDVLLVLAQHARQMVSREDLLASVWPNAVVTDDVLSRCIYELRKQLRQAGGGEQYKEMIETVPKRGYRLNTDVKFSSAQHSSWLAAGRPWRFPALIAAVISVAWLAILLSQRNEEPMAPSQLSPEAAMANSIAVLPFVDMSATQDQEYLADGIAEEILNHLSQTSNLRVIARTSSFAFRDQPVDIAGIAARLDVSHVLEGSVRRSGDEVRITVQLIEVSSNSHVWSQTYDHSIKDLFAVQDEIATSVATALNITLAGAMPRGHPSASVEAYESFLQGEFFYYRRAPGDIERSIRYYQDAISTNPYYAKAWAALAGAYSMLAWNGTIVDKAIQLRQGEAAQRAVELDPRLAVAHARLAQFYSETGDFAKAEEHYNQAAALDPDDPLVLGGSSVAAYLSGDIDGAIAMQRRAVALDPLSTVRRQNLAVLLMASGRLDEALSEFRNVLEFRPDPELETETVRILVLQARYEEAKLAVEKLPAGKYRDHGLALLYQAPGYLEDADAALDRLATEPGEITDSVRLAEVYAFRGMNDDAFATLQEQKADLELDRDSGIAWVEYLQTEARVSPFLKALHSDPRWTVFIAKPG